MTKNERQFYNITSGSCIAIQNTSTYVKQNQYEKSFRIHWNNIEIRSYSYNNQSSRFNPRRHRPISDFSSLLSAQNCYLMLVVEKSGKEPISTNPTTRIGTVSTTLWVGKMISLNSRSHEINISDLITSHGAHGQCLWRVGHGILVTLRSKAIVGINEPLPLCFRQRVPVARVCCPEILRTVIVERSFENANGKIRHFHLSDVVLSSIGRAGSAGLNLVVCIPHSFHSSLMLHSVTQTAKV